MSYRYYLKTDYQTEWSEVSREQFIAAEQSAGFYSKFGPSHPATSGFSSHGMSGRLKYVTKEQPMSDTLQERESGTTTTDYCNECKGRPHAPWCSEFEPPDTEAHQLCPNGINAISAGSEHQIPASAHRTNSSGNCSISGCPCHGWSAQESSKEVTEHVSGTISVHCSICGFGNPCNPTNHHEHQPAARGGSCYGCEAKFTCRQCGAKCCQHYCGAVNYKTKETTCSDCIFDLAKQRNHI